MRKWRKSSQLNHQVVAELSQEKGVTQNLPFIERKEKRLGGPFNSPFASNRYLLPLFVTEGMKPHHPGCRVGRSVSFYKKSEGTTREVERLAQGRTVQCDREAGAHAS